MNKEIKGGKDGLLTSGEMADIFSALVYHLDKGILSWEAMWELLKAQKALTIRLERMK